MLQLICPHCQLPLHNHERQWRCDNNHSYDQARQGYLNLLLVQHKNSRNPGDTPQMLSCRQAFLDAGHYQPVSDAINTLFADLSTGSLVDIGCGEGYYLDRLARSQPQLHCAGLDISKDAVIKACKRHRKVRWLVASSARLPFAEQSLDALLCVFSPWQWEACLKVLKPGGRLLLVGPHSDHLLTLRQGLYPEVHPTPPLIKDLPESMTVVSQQTLRYPVSLNATDLANLIGMTPHGFRSQPERQALLIEQGVPGLEVAMDLIMLQRH
ncbi:MAG: methyltransferase domain-containing protein [Pseudomonadaceae bacterium]|nr:MAG: methyltransferase domain-containing protein [Pseudomonadaceae bacterium]